MNVSYPQAKLQRTAGNTFEMKNLWKSHTCGEMKTNWEEIFAEWQQ